MWFEQVLFFVAGIGALAGALGMVLYLFVVAYIGGADAPLRPESGGVAVFGPLFAVAIAVELCIAFISSGLQALDTRGADVARAENADQFGSPGAIGELLLTDFLLPFEAASFLLLVAAVGAVVLARRRRGLEEVGTGEASPGGRPPGGRREAPTETLEVRV